MHMDNGKERAVSLIIVSGDHGDKTSFCVIVKEDVHLAPN